MLVLVYEESEQACICPTILLQACHELKEEHRGKLQHEIKAIKDNTE